MVNSTLCPLCKNGIGHQMDDAHAVTVRELLETIRWVAQNVHQAHHMDYPGTFRECPKNTCDAAKQAIDKAEATQ